MKPAGDTASTQSTPVQLVPSTFFVASTGSVPRGLRTADTGLYVDGLVDEFSPFPAEQTAWGYLRESGAEEVFFFAAWREAIQTIADTNDTRTIYIVPQFLALCARASRKPGWVFIADDTGLAALHFPNRGRVPDQLRSLYLPEGETGSAAIWRLRDALLKEIDAGNDEVEDGIFRCTQATISRGKSLTFVLEHAAGPSSDFKLRGTRRLGPEAFIYAADVRDTSFLNSERRKRSSARTITRLAMGTAALLVLILGLQIQIWLQEGRAATMTAQVQNQAPIVADLEQKEALIGVVQRYRDDPLRPFDWLMASNEDRPIDLSFGNTRLSRSKSIQISGEAPDVTTINRYRDALQATGQFGNVSITSLNSNQGVVEFSLAMEMPALRLPPRLSPPPAADLDQPVAAGEEASGQPAAESTDEQQAPAGSDDEQPEVSTG